ncbi:hypothetical protein WR25_22352 [Diploscapter pachys]|uniref:SAM-dependent MTase TRM10-type domain-containing protein n=1 Tax=Diploscapter pachys TaxID=2018661 RepID=A0A2A2LJQ2_9BILA|nr:hypothetical protein WR25_22352 [Diploscapter pachys]
MLRNLNIRQFCGLKRIYSIRRCSASNNQPTTSKGLEGEGPELISGVSKQSVDVMQLLPKEFLQESFRNAHKRPLYMSKEKFARRISEIQLFVETFGADALPPLTNEMCYTYMTMGLISERCDYLETLRKQKEYHDRKMNEDRPLISEVNQEKENRGEIVYAPNFNTMFDIKGQDFRKLIDHIFFLRNVWSLTVENRLPQLLVDCQFLRTFGVKTQTKYANEINELHNMNWTSVHPFDISLVNFWPDTSLNEITKRKFYFYYGPSRDPNLANSKPYEPHPFVPKLQSRRLTEAIENAGKDEVIYLSWTSKKALPDTPPANVKYVVLCASNDLDPSTSSLSAAKQLDLPCYRIPTEKHVILYKKHRAIPLRQSAGIMRDYFLGVPLGQAIKTHYNVIGNKIKEDKEVLFDNFKATLISNSEELARAALKNMEYENWLNQSMKPSGSSPSKNPDASQKPQKRHRLHRYTREERNAARRAAEEGQLEMNS